MECSSVHSSRQTLPHIKPHSLKSHRPEFKIKPFYIVVSQDIQASRQWFFLFTSVVSEGTGTDHSHHHYVADSCQHSNPQPNGVAGHFPIVLGVWRSRIAGVEVWGRRLQGHVAIVWRIHEGPTDSWEMLLEGKGREQIERRGLDVDSLELTENNQIKC